VLEELFGREAEPGAVGAGDDLDGEDGVAAEVEEVVVDADARDAERLLPDLRQLPLGGVARGDVGARRGAAGGVGRRQALAVYLPVRRQRQRVERDEGRGHHVFGQLLFQVLAQLVRLLAQPGGPDLLAGEHDVGDQTLLPRHVFAREDDRLADRLVLRERRLDLADLDAEAAQLHLLVGAAEELDLPVGEVAREVARAVEARAGHGAEGVRHERPGG
jgi:hypothetical protein